MKVGTSLSFDDISSSCEAGTRILRMRQASKSKAGWAIRP